MEHNYVTFFGRGRPLILGKYHYGGEVNNISGVTKLWVLLISQELPRICLFFPEVRAQSSLQLSIYFVLGMRQAFFG